MQRASASSGFVGMLLLVVAGAGCASSSSFPGGAIDPNAPARDGLSVWTEGGYAVTASVENGDIVGAVVNLHRAPPGSSEARDDSGTLQGTVFDRPVNLTFRGPSVRGIFGRGPFNLDVIETPEGTTRIQGLAGGAPLEFEITPTRWTGHIGNCGYDMTGQAWRYSGARSCGGRSQRVRIEMGKPISDWPTIDKVTLLGLVLRR